MGCFGKFGSFVHSSQYSQDLLSFCKKKVTKKNCSLFKSFHYVQPDVVTAPAALLTVVARRAYPSPLNAARPSSDSLRSPTPGRLASVNLAARQFLAIAYFASLVTASDLAALTALYLLRESFKLLILLKFLKFLIVCHAQPYVFRLCRNIAAGRTPARAIVTPGWLIHFIQKVPFSFLKRWWVSASLNNFR